MTQITPPRRSGFNGVKVVDVHVNVDQELIQITEDKLRLILKDHLESTTQSGGWIAPFGIIVSIITTFCTAKFDNFLGLNPDFWKALFVFVGIASLVWLIIAINKQSKAMSFNDFIDRVKNKQVQDR